MQLIDIVIGFPMPISLLAKPVRAGFPSPADDFIEEEIWSAPIEVVRPLIWLLSLEDGRDGKAPEA